jgi:TonB family protein
MLIVSGAGAQTDPSTWKTYTVKDERFSFALPAPPTFEARQVWTDARDNHLEITIGSFADGVVYVVYVSENRSPRRSLDTFIKDRASAAYPYNRKTESKLKLEGAAAGKKYSLNGIDGAVQFFSTDTRLFQFAAYGAPQDDARLAKFFSSISLIDNTQVSEPPLPELEPTPKSYAYEQVFTPKEVDKSFRVIMNAHPEYTELARQNQIEGTIVLECTLTANGRISTIRVVSGLPYGLTERSIAAARRLKFIPAMKDGKYVSISTRLVYKFDLF